MTGISGGLYYRSIIEATQSSDLIARPCHRLDIRDMRQVSEYRAGRSFDDVQCPAQYRQGNIDLPQREMSGSRSPSAIFAPPPEIRSRRLPCVLSQRDRKDTSQCYPRCPSPRQPPPCRHLLLHCVRLRRDTLPRVSLLDPPIRGVARISCSA